MYCPAPEPMYCPAPEPMYCPAPEPMYCPPPQPQPDYYSCPPYSYPTNDSYKPQSDNPKDYYQNTTTEDEEDDDDDDWGQSPDDEKGTSKYYKKCPPKSQKPKEPKPFRKGQHDDIYEDETTINLFVNRDFNPENSKYLNGGRSSVLPYARREKTENWDNPQPGPSRKVKVNVKQEYTQAPSQAPVEPPREPSAVPTVYCEEPSGSTVFCDSDNPVTAEPSQGAQKSTTSIPVAASQSQTRVDINSQRNSLDQGRPSGQGPEGNPGTADDDNDIIPPPIDFAQQVCGLRIYLWS